MAHDDDSRKILAQGRPDWPRFRFGDHRSLSVDVDMTGALSIMQFGTPMKRPQPVIPHSRSRQAPPRSRQLGRFRHGTTRCRAPDHQGAAGRAPRWPAYSSARPELFRSPGTLLTTVGPKQRICHQVIAEKRAGAAPDRYWPATDSHTVACVRLRQHRRSPVWGTGGNLSIHVLPRQDLVPIAPNIRL